jgi:hypothetical protein
MEAHHEGEAAGLTRARAVLAATPFIQRLGRLFLSRHNSPPSRHVAFFIFNKINVALFKQTNKQ